MIHAVSILLTVNLAAIPPYPGQKFSITMDSNFPLQLKDGTASLHADLEKKMIPHIKNISGTGDYVQHLAVIYGYYKPLEALLSQFVSNDRFQGSYRWEPKLSSIEHDIRVFEPGYPLPQQFATELPAIKSFFGALGTLYVLEGSNLGGQFISSIIAKKLNIPIDKGFAYYNPHGEETKARWDEFKSELQVELTDDQKQEIIAMANETFLTFKKWIPEYERAIPR